MKNIIASIRDAIDKEAYLPALALALTIPDVCGKVAFPDIEGTGARYRPWFEKYVQKYYWGPSPTNDQNQEDEDESYFTGIMCYALRNKVLHENRADISFTGGEREQGVPHQYEFTLVVNAGNSYGSHIYMKGDEPQYERVHRKVDVKILCNALCNAAEEFAQEVSWSTLEQFDSEILDLKARVERHRCAFDVEIDLSEALKEIEKESQGARVFEVGDAK